jgi:hypothetical protein
MRLAERAAGDCAAITESDPSEFSLSAENHHIRLISIIYGSVPPHHGP